MDEKYMKCTDCDEVIRILAEQIPYSRVKCPHCGTYTFVEERLLFVIPNAITIKD